MIRWGCIALVIFLSSCKEANVSEANPYDFYYVEMPLFIGDRTGDSCDPSIAGYWSSMDEKIGITYMRATILRKTLNPSGALKKAIETKWFYMETKPDLKKISSNRYLSVQKTPDLWEVVIVEETEKHRFWIEMFSIYGRDKQNASSLSADQAQVIVDSLELGRYVDRNTYISLLPAPTPSTKQSRLVVYLHDDGSLWFDDQEISLSYLAELSRQKVSDFPKPRLHLKAEKTCETDDIRAVVVAAAEGGLVNIIFGAYVSQKP